MKEFLIVCYDVRKKEHRVSTQKTFFVTCSDTGYRAVKDGPTCPVFKQIGDKFGGVDFAAIPIWRGGTLSFVSSFGLRVSPTSKGVQSNQTRPDLHYAF